MKQRMISILLLLLCLAGCAGQKGSVVKQEGIEPDDISERERNLLQALGMEDSVQILSFRAPKEAVSMHIGVYRLNRDTKAWDKSDEGAVSIGLDTDDSLEGTFAMQLKENYTIDFHIRTNGTASYETEEILLDEEILGQTKKFLDKYQKLQLNQEIPVALMVYDSGTRMESCSLQDYFEPSNLAEMDLVQAVTLQFSD